MKFSVIPTVNIIIVSEGKVLLSRRKNTGWMDGSLAIPGGHVEEGETPQEAILREIKEELGADVTPEDMTFLCAVMRNIHPIPHAAYVFTMDYGRYSFDNAEPDKCSELVWVDPLDMPEDVIEDYRVVLDKGYVGKKQYFEVGYSGES